MTSEEEEEEEAYPTNMDNKYKLELDSSEMCRGCLARNCPLTNLMCNEIVDGDILPMPTVYESVTGLPVKLIWNGIEFRINNWHFNVKFRRCKQTTACRRNYASFVRRK